MCSLYSKDCPEKNEEYSSAKSQADRQTDKPLGPRTRTVRRPGPAPRVSTSKSLWNVASKPDCSPGPLTRTLLASAAQVTLMLNGEPTTTTHDDN